MRKRLVAPALMLAVLLAGCGEEAQEVTDEPGELSGRLVVWSFTDEMGDMIEPFNEVYPDIEVEFVVIPNADEQYLNRITNAMRSRSATPDVFTGERAFFRQFIESDYWEPISGEPYNAEELVGDLVEYVTELSRNTDGDITALSWQATPGGLFYRRDIAQDILGTDDPDAVSEWTSDLDRFYELGEMIREEYDGERYLLSGYTDMTEFVYNQRSEPYIVDDRLVIPESLVEFMQVAREMRENRIEAGATTWDPPWFSSMADGSVFAYILPTWGLHYVMKPNAEPEADEGNAEFRGDWGLASPPAAYTWGGTWVGINRNSEQKDLAWAFVEFVGSNPEFHEEWARSTGDFVSNTNVLARIQDDFSDPFLDGQNHYAYFFDQVQQVDVSFIGPWDFQIQNAWGDEVEQFVNGQKTLDEAIADFETAARDFLPNISEVVVERP
ncbi:MAG: extracellular solute-binding protein [Spirochaetota bacterium]